MSIPQAKVYTAVDMAFVADRLAEVDALLTFVLDCARTSVSYKQFVTKLNENLGEVKITQAINIEDWLDSHNEGWVLITRPKTPTELGFDTDRESIDAIGPDYLRDDDGIPYIFDSKSQAFEALPKDHVFIRTLDLKERHERKNETK